MMTNPGDQRTGKAVRLYLIAVGIFSWLPLIVSYRSSSISPLNFFGTWMFTGGLVCAIFATRWDQGLQRSHQSPRSGSRFGVAQTTRFHLRDRLKWDSARPDSDTIRERVFSYGFLFLWFFSTLDWLLFERAVNTSEPASATVIYELNPSLVVILLWLWPVSASIYDSDSTSDTINTANASRFRILLNKLPLILLSGAGVALVALGQAPSITFASIVAVSGYAVAAAVMGAVSAASSNRLPHWLGLGDLAPNERATIIMYMKSRHLMAIGLLSIAVGSAYSLVNGNPIVFSSFAIPAIGGAIGGLGDYYYFHSNQLRASEPWINSLYNLTPVLALVWLTAASHVDVLKLDWFVLGAATVVTANTLLHLDPEGAESKSPDQQYHDKVRGWAYRSLVISILGAGAFMYFRDDLLPNDWQKWAFEEYWGIVALSATVFVLILSFRISRISEQTRNEDTLMLELHRQAEHYIAEHILEPCPGKALGEQLCRKPKSASTDCDLLWHLQQANRSAETYRMTKHYFASRRIVAAAIQKQNATSAASVALRQELYEYQARLDRFANLRQSGREFAEVVSMVIFGGLTVFVALFLRPNSRTGTPESWVGFATELIGMAVASAVAFLVFNLFDKQGERDTSIIRAVSRSAREKEGQPPGWWLNIAVYQDVTWHRRISSAIVIAVVGVMTWLVHYKWFVIF